MPIHVLAFVSPDTLDVVLVASRHSSRYVSYDKLFSLRCVLTHTVFVALTSFYGSARSVWDLQSSHASVHVFQGSDSSPKVSLQAHELPLHINTTDVRFLLHRRSHQMSWQLCPGFLCPFVLRLFVDDGLTYHRRPRKQQALPVLGDVE